MCRAELAARNAEIVLPDHVGGLFAGGLDRRPGIRAGADAVAEDPHARLRQLAWSFCSISTIESAYVAFAPAVPLRGVAMGGRGSGSTKGVSVAVHVFRTGLRLATSARFSATPSQLSETAPAQAKRDPVQAAIHGRAESARSLPRRLA
jgi:hypothetical protein